MEAGGAEEEHLSRRLCEVMQSVCAACHPQIHNVRSWTGRVSGRIEDARCDVLATTIYVKLRHTYTFFARQRLASYRIVVRIAGDVAWLVETTLALPLDLA